MLVAVVVTTSALALASALAVAAMPAAAAQTQALSPLQQASAGRVPSGPGFHLHRGGRGESDVNICSYAVQLGEAHCDAHIRIDAAARAARPARGSGGTSPSVLGDNGAYDPAYLQSAYNVAAAAATDGGGVGKTVAIVDAYDDPNVASDLAYYRSYFGLSACPSGTVSPTASGCVFEKVNQNGVAGSYPKGNTSWGVEISLDVEMVSAICSHCQILLVEANNNSIANLGAAVNTAVAMGAGVVSNSYGSEEFSTEATYDAAYYHHPGVAIVASAGDSGYGVEFPAAAGDVTAVGGTSLTQLSNTGVRDGSETAWSGTGAGCSAYEPKPSWQLDSGCPRRTVADVSAVADPNTGVWVYDTYGAKGWAIYGGTSVAAPIISSFYALAGATPGGTSTPSSYPYKTPASLYDVLTGSDGSCSPLYLCTAGPGYDGPTGLGTPGGSPSSVAAFMASGESSPPPPPPPTVPGAPRNLTAARAPSRGVALAWSAPLSNGGASITSYELYRGRSSGGEQAYVKVACTALACSYTDTGTSRGLTYYYETAAINAVGVGALSNQASAVAR